MRVRGVQAAVRRCDVQHKRSDDAQSFSALDNMYGDLDSRATTPARLASVALLERRRQHNTHPAVPRRDNAWPACAAWQPQAAREVSSTRTWGYTSARRGRSRCHIDLDSSAPRNLSGRRRTSCAGDMRDIYEDREAALHQHKYVARYTPPLEWVHRAHGHAATPPFTRMRRQGHHGRCARCSAARKRLSERFVYLHLVLFQPLTIFALTLPRRALFLLGALRWRRLAAMRRAGTQQLAHRRKRRPVHPRTINERHGDKVYVICAPRRALRWGFAGTVLLVALMVANRT
ncbi:hypothetical protein DFH06DRAFT_1137189 [Mycena polygramma]|nr:hypothetical protein DFH06DRAFT_1137189 [Mycena polygramma]